LFGFALEEVESIPSRIRQTNRLNEVDRMNSILRGYQRADACLRNGEHASYFENANTTRSEKKKYVRKN